MENNFNIRVIAARDQKIRMRRALQLIAFCVTLFAITSVFGILPYSLLYLAIGMAGAYFCLILVSPLIHRDLRVGGIYATVAVYIIFLPRYLNSFSDMIYALQFACVHLTTVCLLEMVGMFFRIEEGERKS